MAEGELLASELDDSWQDFAKYMFASSADAWSHYYRSTCQLRLGVKGESSDLTVQVKIVYMHAS
jgi:hypothetical protein